MTARVQRKECNFLFIGIRCTLAPPVLARVTKATRISADCTIHCSGCLSQGQKVGKVQSPVLVTVSRQGLSDNPSLLGGRPNEVL